jgi:hypothetical protein
MVAEEVALLTTEVVVKKSAMSELRASCVIGKCVRAVEMKLDELVRIEGTPMVLL